MRVLTLTAGFIFALVVFQPVHAEERTQAGDLTILITGFKSSMGHAVIKVMNSEHALTSGYKSFSMIKSRVVDGRVEIVLKGIPYGQYAITVFHDRNDNNVLDKNIKGKPKEGYGFSNNARGRFEAPAYDSMRFDLRAPSVTQQIIIR